MTKTGPSDAGRTAVRGTGRVVAVDAARALAIIGMLAVNVGPKDGTGVWGRLYSLPHGRASLLFVLLAGMGVSMLSRRVRAPSREGLGRHWATLLWRAALLLVGGLALQRLDHEVSVILPSYAVLFVLAGVLLRAPDRGLLVGAAALTVLGPLLWLGAQRLIGRTYTYEAAALGDPPETVVHSILLSGPYPVVTWAAPFLLGMWLGRQDLTSRGLQLRLMVAGTAVALLAPALSATAASAVGASEEETTLGLLVTSVAHGQMPLWLVGGTAASLAVLGLCLWGSHLMDRWLWPLVATGQLALTVYVGHLFALHWLRPAPHDLTQGVLITVVMTVVAVALCTAWRAVFSRGPLEVVIRPPWTWARR